MESWIPLLASIGLLVLFVGIVLVVLGILLTISRRRSSEKRKGESEPGDKRGKVRGGGVVLIGPIPIIFGTDRKALLIAVAASLVFMVLYLVLLLRS